MRHISEMLGQLLLALFPQEIQCLEKKRNKAFTLFFNTDIKLV